MLDLLRIKLKGTVLRHDRKRSTIASATLAPSMARHRLVSAATRAVVALFILGISLMIVGGLMRTAPGLEVAPTSRLLPAVLVMEARPIPVERRTVGYGVADALDHADVSAEVSGQVVELPATSRAGQRVREGELLVVLDETDYQQQVRRAEQVVAQLVADQSLMQVERAAAEQRAELAGRDRALAKAELDRVQQAFEKGAARQREVDQATQQLISRTSAQVNARESADQFPPREEGLAAQLLTREVDLATARTNLARCRIASPIDGVLQNVDVRVGENVSPGQRVGRVVDSSRIEIPLRLPSHARPHVGIGDIVELRSAGFGRRRWQGRVTRLAPEDDTRTRTLIAYIDIEQLDDTADRIPPGIFLRGDVISSGPGQLRWTVPRRAVREDRIMVVRDGIIHSLPVAIDFSVAGEFSEFGLPDRAWAVLATPLTEGDMVIVDPSGSLRDGMEVRPLLAADAFAPGATGK